MPCAIDLREEARRAVEADLDLVWKKADQAVAALKKPNVNLCVVAAASQVDYDHRFAHEVIYRQVADAAGLHLVAAGWISGHKREFFLFYSKEPGPSLDSLRALVKGSNL